MTAFVRRRFDAWLEKRSPPCSHVELNQRRIFIIPSRGGAAYLVSKAIRKSRVAAFEDLGMEAIYEFEVEDMPVTVAVDSTGESVHKTGPVIWKQKIAEKSA